MTLQYSGENSPSEFALQIARAELEEITLGRINDKTLELTERQSSILRFCYNYLSDYIEERIDDITNNIASYNINGVSVTYDAKEKEKERVMPYYIKNLMISTGLCKRGF